MISERWKKLCDKVIIKFINNESDLYKTDWLHLIYGIFLETDSQLSLNECEKIFDYLFHYKFYGHPWNSDKKYIFRAFEIKSIQTKLYGKITYGQDITYFRLPWHQIEESPGEKLSRFKYQNQTRLTPEKIPIEVKLSKKQRQVIKQTSKKGTHICQRCGSMIAGKGRHNKKRRGHTQEICDFFMTKNIMKS